MFDSVMTLYDDVFNPNIKGYNGAFGPVEGKVNRGPVEPPQCKDRLPQYVRQQLVALQEKFGALETPGVVKRPELVNVTVELKKASGGSRLVTAFADVGRYSKPQPSLMPDVDSTLRLIAQ